MRITFLGGAGTVTGSKYLLENDNGKIMIDCGLFQGYKQLRLMNRRPFPLDLSKLDAILLTHAHIDHSGYLPLMVRNGFKGVVYATEATRDLCKILLRDSAYLQEKDADFANKHGFSKHHPAEPLYTQKDAEEALKLFEVVKYEKMVEVIPELKAEFINNGHILGSSMIRVTGKKGNILFSGDMGRSNDPIMKAPPQINQANYVVVESTYGNREHDRTDPKEILSSIINKTSERGGTVLIPSFAVGRTQLILYYIYKMKQEGLIRDLPVFLDSPMAINASELFSNHNNLHKLSEAEAKAVCNTATYTREVEESQSLDKNGYPKVIISASGMATGGRILHHLKHFVEDEKNTVLFAGYQAGGTRGARMVSGEKEIKIHGRYYSVRADVEILDMMSAHADSTEIMGWLGGFDSPPKSTFITHGEPDSSDALRLKIEEDLGWFCNVPAYGDKYEIDV